jgi:hypothetical protein
MVGEERTQLAFNSSIYAIEVDMEQWTAERHAFFAETFSKQSEMAVTHKLAHTVMYYDK